MARAVRAVGGDTLPIETLVLDTQPLVAYLEQEPGGELIETLLDRARRQEARLLMAVVNATEVLVVAERRRGPEASHQTLDLLQELPIDLVVVDLELAARAAYFKVRDGISLADSFAAALAHREDVPLLSGDPELERVSDVVDVRWFRGSVG